MKTLLYKSFRSVYRITNWLKWRFTTGGLLVLGGRLVYIFSGKVLGPPKASSVRHSG